MTYATAYHAGRNSVWFEQANINPLSGELAEAWARGRRQALVDERLDADTEWNAETQ